MKLVNARLGLELEFLENQVLNHRNDFQKLCII